MKPIDSIPIFAGREGSVIALTPREIDAVAWGERNGFVVVDQRVRRLVRLWFFWCEARNRPSIIVNRRKGDRAVVTLDLYCTDRCLTRAGWKAVVDAYERHGSLAMRRVQRKGFVFGDYVFGVVAWPEADRLARELLAITNAGSLVRVCDRAPEGAARR